MSTIAIFWLPAFAFYSGIVATLAFTVNHYSAYRRRHNSSRSGNGIRSSFYFILVLVLTSCSVHKRIVREAGKAIFNDSVFSTAHVGISVFDPAANRYLYNYQGDKYFVPASNTKLFSCYAGLKYLGDSIPAARYKVEDDVVFIQASGDPTFLHPDFKSQRLFQFLSQKKFSRVELYTGFASEPLGRGWAWDDYKDDYMAERDPFPMYGDLATFTFNGDTLTTVPQLLGRAVAGTPVKNQPWNVTRNLAGHFFTIIKTGTTAPQKVITMAMDKGIFDARYLADTLHKPVGQYEVPLSANETTTIYSQPTDSLFKMMMHRSDNFFAEQTLMMVSNAKLGMMSDTRIIDTLLKTDYKEAPQKPKWVDGSGLSRYNLFSPQDFVWLLNKMKIEFGLDRMKEILPTGGEGTLGSLYNNYSGRIYAKTGTLSNHVALSGYLLTNKNKLLIFSVLVNNHQASATDIRKGIEKFVTTLIDKY